MVHGLFLLAIFILASTKLVMGQPSLTCQTKCGNVSIEYPFGISTGCYYAGDPSFNITCDPSNKLIFGGNEVINISPSGELRVLNTRSYVCYDRRGNETGRINRWSSLGNLTFSDKNRFIAVGCNTYAFLNTDGVGNYSTGCMSTCTSPRETNGSCTGGGCCQTSLPRGSHYFMVSPYSFSNHTSVYSFNPCSYAFLVEDGKYNFSSSEDLMNLRNIESFPVVLDWAIGQDSCEYVGSENICRGNSICSNSVRGTGYICKCKEGFDGNPYLSDENGCQGSSTCENTVGHFLCNCPSGYNLNATNNSCMRKGRPEYYGWTQIFLGKLPSLVQRKMKHRKNTELRKHFFEQNGGGMLRQRLSGAGTSNVDVKIFTEEGMKEATNGYDESRILGQGGQGTVYKGILPDNSIVAIKKARLGDSSQVEQFINEVLVLSQINHRNVVRLLGCCLETEVPLLVYEFINSGTLYDNLHDSMSDSSLTWEHRLRIAVEIAGTLAYLHSSASIPIIHRDVKTANILLDENLTAKVADFGASRLIPMDKEQLTTMVQGTLGYLDPEYYNTGLLNEKSDVYSFGVVLMELLSGQKALLHEVIDGQMMNENNYREIQEAARVAVKCTRVTGEERPKMKEVAAQLEGLRVTKTKHQRSDDYPEPMEMEHLLGLEILSAQGETSSTGYDSIKNITRIHVESGR
ncbi:hypothetical protein Bca101_066493 [Brassica carinata]